MPSTPGLGELRPQLAVEVLVAALDLLQTLVGELTLEDLRGQTLQVLLFLARRRSPL